MNLIQSIIPIAEPKVLLITGCYLAMGELFYQMVKYFMVDLSTGK